MKKIIFIINSFCVGLIASAQNPFAKKEFYTAFKKVYADGQKGFIETTGMFKNESNGYYSFHLPKILLPGADSGQITLPLSLGYPFVIYYFPPAKTLAAAKQKEKNLHDAIKTAWGNPALTAVKTNDTAKNFVSYTTWFYKNKNDIKNYMSAFNTRILFEKNAYQFELTINGQNTPPQKNIASKGLWEEPELNKKIETLMTSMAGHFADEKDIQTDKTEYYTQYESKTIFYGNKCKIKDRKFEASFNFTTQYPKLDHPSEAKTIYEKLKEAFIRTGRFTFNKEIQEGTRTYIYGAENISTRRWKVSSFSVVIEYYSSSSTPSVSFLITSKKLSTH